MSNSASLSYWLGTVPATEFGSVPLPPQAEVVIVGAGIMGSALAYWLTRAGQSAWVLERNAHPAGGATGRNGGLLISGPAQTYGVTSHSLGRAAAREITKLTQLNQRLIEEVLEREAIAAGYAVTGFLALAGQPDEVAELQASAEALRADGFGGEWLDRAAAEDRLGTALGPEYVGALFKPEDAVVHSAHYNFGVAQAAARLGAQFAYSTRVEAVAAGPGGRGWSITTSRGKLLAEQVVVAVNAWAGDLFPELEELIVPTRGHVVLTAPVNFRIRPWVANWGYEYGRQLDNGQLLVGGKRQRRADMDQGHRALPGENVPRALPEVVAALTDFVPGLFPAAAGAPIVHHWTGLMGFSPDGQPLAGAWPGRPGLWLLAGFSGHGMPYSQALPYALATRLTGQPGPNLPAAFDPARFLGAAGNAAS